MLSDPNSLTLFRIAAAPGIVVLLFFPNRICTFLAAILFSAAAITDYFDGYFARQRGMTSAFGKAMDPLADKLLISSSLIMLASLGWIPGWVVCVIIARELAITGLRGMISDKGADVSASNLGKYKTGFQIAAIIPLIFHFPYFGVNLHAIGMFFLWGALIFSLWSGIDYLIRFGKLIDI
ncbi:MAG: CDP-diacylglycerol--glycerol-3-phosphate 3-phosphatidyltransferase [Desulfobacteraceae bacterium IS3]|nr:MAG: CDP-diacylglycerol--glycerol-3-phosphate 3-phosphatidyltransferase [Desulfobacteraceae bacterium IS3]